MPLIAVEGDIDSHNELGALIAANPKTVFIHGIPVIVVGDVALPDVTNAGSNSNGNDMHDHPNVTSGSPTVFAYNIAIHREDDDRSCGAETYVIQQPDVFADGGTSYTTPNGVPVYNNPNGYRALKDSVQFTSNGGEAATRDELETYTQPALIPSPNSGTPAFDGVTIDTSSTTATIAAITVTPSTICNIVIKTTSNEMADTNTMPVDRSMQLSKYFTVGNFLLDGNWIPKTLPLSNAGGFRTEALSLPGISGKANITGDEIICNLQAIATNLLDPLMDQFNGGNRIPLNAAFRMPGRKRMEGQHGMGMAVDLQQFPGFNHQMAYDIAKWIIENLPFDQLLLEKIGVNPWIHVSYNRNGNRPPSATNKIGVLYPVTNTFSSGLKRPPY
jgi:hypothetical protein